MLIDWLSVLANSFWVLGLAFLLAGCGMAYYRAALAGPVATSDRSPWRRSFSASGIQRLFLLGAGLICLSLTFLSTAIWERSFWVLGLSFCLIAWPRGKKPQ